jgi:ADP-ribose pyrophosphatase
VPVRRPVYEAKKFRVVQQDVIGRDGSERVYDVIVHPGAAVILPLLDDGRVVLLANYRAAVGAELWELPAGTLDGPEEPIACARRELAEETGYQAGRVTPLVSYYSTPGICTERMHAFVATELAAGEQRLEPGERIRVVPMEYEDAIQAVRDGRIIDAKTIATLLYYDRFVRDQGSRE